MGEGGGREGMEDKTELDKDERNYFCAIMRLVYRPITFYASRQNRNRRLIA